MRNRRNDQLHNAQVSRGLEDLNMEAGHFSQKTSALLGNDFYRNGNERRNHEAGVLPPEYNIVSEKQRPPNLPYPLQGSGSPKRLIPMAKPRLVSPQAALNDLGYDSKSKTFLTTRQIIHERYKNKYKNITLGQQKDALASRERRQIQRLLMNQSMSSPSRRIAKKNFQDEWGRESSIRKIQALHHQSKMMQANEKQSLNRIDELNRLHAQKYRQELRRSLVSNSEVRRMFEREVADYGAKCARWPWQDKIDRAGNPRAVKRIAAGSGDMRGRPIGMQQSTQDFPPGQQIPVSQGQFKEPVQQKPVENVNGPWIPPQEHQSRLPQVPLTVDDVDDRQLVAQDVNLCMQNLRCLLHLSREVLILAESDFSFSSALVDYMPKNSHMVATSFESDEKLQELHKEKLENHKKILLEHNATILHNIDACCIEETIIAAIEKKSKDEQDLIGSRWSGHFDLVWIQLPHTGGSTKTNSSMIQRFLGTVGRVLKPNGLVFITLYGMQVDHWKVSQHAKSAEMVHVFKVPFNTDIYPAIWTRYNPKVGFSNGQFDILRHPCETFVFAQNEFTCVSKLKAVDKKILSGLRKVKINTISDLAAADKRLLTDDVDPKFMTLIRQAKAWFQVWGELLREVPRLTESMPLQGSHQGGRYESTPYY